MEEARLLEDSNGTLNAFYGAEAFPSEAQHGVEVAQAHVTQVGALRRKATV